MRFPVSSTAFYRYVDLLGLETKPFPNPLTPASGSTVIGIEGESHYAESSEALAPRFQQVAAVWVAALETVHFTDIQDAIRARDVHTLKSLWNALVPRWGSSCSSHTGNPEAGAPDGSGVRAALSSPTPRR